MQYAAFRHPKRCIALNESWRPSRLCGERVFNIKYIVPKDIPFLFQANQVKSVKCIIFINVFLDLKPFMTRNEHNSPKFPESGRAPKKFFPRNLEIPLRKIDFQG